MGRIINLFPVKNGVDREELSGRMSSKELQEFFNGFVERKPGDILQWVECGGDRVGMLKLWGYSNKKRVGVLRWFFEPRVHPSVVKESFEEFIRLAFNTHPKMQQIYWNIHPDNHQMLEIAKDLTFQAIDPSLGPFSSRDNIRYRSFFLERLKR